MNPRRPAPEDFSASTPLSPPPSPRGVHSPLLRPGSGTPALSTIPVRQAKINSTIKLKDLGPSKQQKDTPKISTFNSNLKHTQQKLFQVAPLVQKLD